MAPSKGSRSSRKSKTDDAPEDGGEKKKKDDAAVGSISHILKTLFRGLYEDAQAEADAIQRAQQEKLEAASGKRRKKTEDEEEEVQMTPSVSVSTLAPTLSEEAEEGAGPCRNQKFTRLVLGMPRGDAARWSPLDHE